jgi:hypothetical protein
MTIKQIIRKKLHNQLTIRWNIGFVDFQPDSFLLQNELKIHWMKHNFKDRWFADPFILNITSTEIVLLVEEFYYPIHRGRIARITVDRESFALKKIVTVLELESHFSFPAIFTNGDKVYIYPENSETGRLILYKYNDKDVMVKQLSILIDEPLTDAIITTFFDRPFIFSTKLPMDDGDELCIYTSDKWNGRYKLYHKVKFKDNIARNAGAIFKIGDKFIRPAQIYNKGYGKGLVMQEVIFEDNKFSFNELKRFYPTYKEWNLGMHTFNVYENLAVVDAKQYRNRTTAKILIFLKGVLKSLRFNMNIW